MPESTALAILRVGFLVIVVCLAVLERRLLDIKKLLEKLVEQSHHK